MTKKHFNRMAAEFAAILRTCTTDAERDVVARSITAFIVVAKMTNPAFDAAYFREACKA